jgi:hypothetical protein
MGSRQWRSDVARLPICPLPTAFFSRAVSSAVERFVYTEDVGGSIPSPPTIVSRQGKVHLKPSGVVMAGVPYGRPYQAPFAVR